jgi:hypothetical protein
VAEDLNPPPRITPPPSPFAKPDAPVVESTDENVLVRKPRSDWEPGPHAGRFMVAYGILGLVLGVTVVALAVALTRGDSPPPVAWSAWKPGDSGTERVRDIAAHIAARYRQPNGNQLVDVVPRSVNENPPIIAAAIDKQALFEKEQQYSTFPVDKSLMFVFCGDGQNCTLQGQPTIERHRLLRREALELALYSFRYMDGVDSVVTFLPGGTDAAAGKNQPAVRSALFFRKSQYDNFTKAPLAETLPGTPAETNSSLSQAKLVDRLTLPALYRSELKLTPDGGNSILVLIPAVTG